MIIQQHTFRRETRNLNENVFSEKMEKFKYDFIQVLLFISFDPKKG